VVVEVSLLLMVNIGGPNVRGEGTRGGGAREGHIKKEEDIGQDVPVARRIRKSDGKENEEGSVCTVRRGFHYFQFGLRLRTRKELKTRRSRQGAKACKKKKPRAIGGVKN